MPLIEPGVYCGVFTFHGKPVGIQRVDIFGVKFHLNFEEMTITRLSTADTRPMKIERQYFPELESYEISCSAYKF